jgi:Helicase conserved C-terminal domain
MLDVSMRSLKRRLAEHDDLLAVVARVWGVAAGSTTEAALLAALGERMQNRFAARSIWQQLAEVERRVLYEVLCASSRAQGVPCERVQKKAKVPADAFEAALTQLRDRWILLEEDEIPAKPTKRRDAGLSLAVVQPPELVRAIFPYQELSESLYRTGRELFLPYEVRSMQSFRHLVSMLSWETLVSLARLCHVPVHTGIPVYAYGATPSISHPSEVQRSVVEAMLQQPLIVFDLVNRLDTVGQGLWLWLCERGGKANMAEVLAYLAERHCAGEECLALFQAFEAHALAFDALLPGGERALFIPGELFAAIKDEASERLGDEQSHALFPVFSDPPGRREGEPVLLYDLATIVAWIYQHRIEQTREEKIPKRWASKIRPMLQGLPRRNDVPEDLYLDQLFHTARGLSLLRCDATDAREKPSFRPGPKLDEFGKLSASEQVRRFLEWWIGSTSWYDVRPDGKTSYPGASSTARKALLSALKQCIPGRWYRVEALLFSLWKQAPLYLYDPYRRQPERLTMRERRARWMQQEGMRYAAFLFSTLHEAGVVSLGYTHPEPAVDDPPTQFLVTPLGAQAIADAPGSSPAFALPLLTTGDTRLIVQPSFELLLFQFDPQLVYRLVQFAQIKHIGPVSTFELNQAALLRGLETGNQVEQVLALLSEWTRQELPQNVAYSLRDWSRGYREAHLEEVILVELSPPTQGEEALYRVLSGLRINPRKLAPGIFVVIPGPHSFFELRRRLEEEGVVVRGEPRPVPPRW